MSILIPDDATSLQDIELLVKTDVTIALAADAIREVLSNPPFHAVSGVFNIRDIGQPKSNPPVRSNFLFRSGMITLISDMGKKKLTSDLGVKKIFDLRSAAEREKFGAPNIEGVNFRWLPTAQDPRPVVLDEFGGEDGGLNAMVEMYRDILVTHVPVFREVFEHIRDEGDKPALFHCAGGKDRTGVLTALVLRIAGCSPALIARDYTLTRIGMEPARDTVLKDFLSDKYGDLKMRKGLAGMCSVNFETMIRFLEVLEGSYERGAEGYVKDVLGFSDEDLEKIRKNLTV